MIGFLVLERLTDVIPNASLIFLFHFLLIEKIKQVKKIPPFFIKERNFELLNLIILRIYDGFSIKDFLGIHHIEKILM